MPDPDASDAPIPASKKRRLQVSSLATDAFNMLNPLYGACDICRSKKIRCDSARMPNNICSNCISFGSDCTHFASAANKRTSTKQTQRADDKPRTPIQKQISAILSTTSPFSLPQDPAAALRILVDVAAYAKSLEQEVAVLREATLPDLPIVDPSTSYTRPPTPTDLSLSATDGCVLTELNERMKGLMVDSSHNRFYGSSSDIMLVKTAMDIKRESGEDKNLADHLLALKRPEYWLAKPWHQPPPEAADLYVFPEDDLLHSLMSLYFFHCHPFIPLLHRQTFEKAVAGGLHLRDGRFGATLLLVCALASRYSKDPRVILQGTNSELSCGWKWAGQIRLVRQSFTTTPSLYDVQICLVFLQGTGCPELCWVLTSIGIRLAQDVGAHRRRRYTGDKQAEDQLWTRAFWVLVCIDILLSASFGRPRATTADDFDLDLPIECDDIYWEDSEAPFKQPSGVPSLLAYLNCYIKLLDILGFAQRTLYTLKRSKKRGKEAEQWNQQVVAELEYNNWIDSLPDHLKWDPHRENFIFFQQSASLYASYYHVQIQIHRPFIPAPSRSSPLSYPSLAVCANSARSCAHVMDVQSRRGILPLAHVKMALFDSSVILLLIIWSGRKNGVVVDTSKEIYDVHTCLNIMKSFERRWQVAGRLWDTMYAMLSAGELLEEPVPPSLKRDREPEGQSPGSHESPGASTASGSEASGYPHTPSYIGEHISPPVVPPIPPQPAVLPVHSSDLGRLPGQQWQFEIANPFTTSGVLASYLGPDSGFVDEESWSKLPSDYFPSLVDNTLGSEAAPNWTYTATTGSWAEWEQFNPGRP
ncbi:fungal-specific transcription factor domain-containing protein [Mycena amicta]|nr:fungal-specific transcription factor domain-containing protein [Mycena amicta]